MLLRWIFRHFLNPGPVAAPLNRALAGFNCRI
jgi:hypothetical protein